MDTPSHPLDLVTVFEAQDTFALTLAKASLDDHGIAYIVLEQDTGCLPGFNGGSGIGATPLWKCACHIRVSAADEATARELLEPLTALPENSLLDFS